MASNTNIPSSFGYCFVLIKMFMGQYSTSPNLKRFDTTNSFLADQSLQWVQVILETRSCSYTGSSLQVAWPSQLPWSPCSRRDKQRVANQHLKPRTFLLLFHFAKQVIGLNSNSRSRDGTPNTFLEAEVTQICSGQSPLISLTELANHLSNCSLNNKLFINYPAN
jgi:hypothetical protein